MNEPRILGDAFEIASLPHAGSAGALWKLDPDPRHLDSNIIRIPAGGRIEAHEGPDLDVMLLVLAGTGDVATETTHLGLAPGALVWLPRRSQRSIIAGSSGLTYLTVHTRKPPLGIGTTSSRLPF